jgi:hypothetical protein
LAQEVTQNRLGAKLKSTCCLSLLKYYSDYLLQQSLLVLSATLRRLVTTENLVLSGQNLKQTLNEAVMEHF